MSGPRRVSASVRFAQSIGAGGVVRVLVEDTSRAGAAAAVVAETELPLVRSLEAGERLDATLTIPDVDEHARYDVRVHVDCTGSGTVTPGDRITTRAYPVATRGSADHVEVEVVEV